MARHRAGFLNPFEMGARARLASSRSRVTRLLAMTDSGPGRALETGSSDVGPVVERKVFDPLAVIDAVDLGKPAVRDTSADDDQPRIVMASFFSIAHNIFLRRSGSPSHDCVSIILWTSGLQ